MVHGTAWILNNLRMILGRISNLILIPAKFNIGNLGIHYRIFTKILGGYYWQVLGSGQVLNLSKYEFRTFGSWYSYHDSMSWNRLVKYWDDTHVTTLWVDLSTLSVDVSPSFFEMGGIFRSCQSPKNFWEVFSGVTPRNFKYFGNFHPTKLGKISNLTIIFFKWVGSTTNSSTGPRFSPPSPSTPGSSCCPGHGRLLRAHSCW